MTTLGRQENSHNTVPDSTMVDIRGLTGYSQHLVQRRRLSVCCQRVKLVLLSLSKVCATTSIQKACIRSVLFVLDKTTYETERASAVAWRQNEVAT